MSAFDKLNRSGMSILGSGELDDGRRWLRQNEAALARIARERKAEQDAVRHRREEGYPYPWEIEE